MNEKIIGHATVFLILIVAAITVFNAFQIAAMSGGSSGTTTGLKGSTLKVQASGNTVQDVMKALIPTGVPAYGTALGVTYDDPVTGVKTLANLDRQISMNALTPEQKERYLKIGTQISCEFCCGVPSVIDSSGRNLCGCAHAAAFRGLSKYMLQTYPDLTDDEILMELIRWKSLFYPRNMVEKGVAAVDNGLELTPQVLNDPQLLKKIQANDMGAIGELPQMVGGC